MTIASTTSKLLYNGDGATTVFAISFVFWQAGDIRVIHRDANGAETLWVEGTHYTIAGGAGDTGTLTVITTPTDHTPAAGEKLLIKSAIAELQPAALPLGGAFPSTTVERMADIATRLVQQNSEKHERTIRVPEADPAAPLVELPPRAARAGKMIGFDSAGQLTALEPTDGSAAAVTAAGSTTSRLLAEHFSDLINVRDYGAVGDGVTDDDAARVAAQGAMAQNHILLFPGPNTYRMGADLPTGPFLWLNKGFTGGVSPGNAAVNTALLVTAETADTSPLDAVESRIGISITAQANGAQHASGIRSNLVNYSTDGQGCAAMYAQSVTLPSSLWTAALHGETRHDGGTSIAGSFESASYSTAGAFYGIVVNNTTTGAPATHPISGAAKAAHPTATAIYVQGANGTDPQGGWFRGLRFALDTCGPAAPPFA